MGKAAEPDVRQRVHDAVRRYPGIHLREIERQTGISAPLAQYHLRKLVDEREVESREQGSYLRFYPSTKGRRLPERDRGVVGLLREEVPLHVVLLLLDKGPMTHTQLVEGLGVAKSTVSYHLHKLAEAGVVERRSKDTRIHLSDRERVYRLVDVNPPTPDLIDRFGRLWEDLYG